MDNRKTRFMLKNFDDLPKGTKFIFETKHKVEFEKVATQLCRPTKHFVGYDRDYTALLEGQSVFVPY